MKPSSRPGVMKRKSVYATAPVAQQSSVPVAMLPDPASVDQTKA